MVVLKFEFNNLEFDIMKRSEINQIIREAKEFLASRQFVLPEWAEWSLADWKANRDKVGYITERMLGWDITDFGSGDFKRCGLFLFTIRNGKYGVDKKLHKSEHSPFEVSPYCMLIHNQRYYLMAYHEKWNSMVFHRLDRITELELLEADAYPLKKVSGYEKGIDYEKLSGARPYMYSDEPEHVVLIADVKIIDQIIDWFGKGIDISKPDEEAMVKISMDVSLLAMKYWALQYVDSVEVVEPVKLRESIVESLNKGLEKYNSHNFHTY